MNELIKAAILGLVQGASEFIPISSSGHLVIVPWLFGWKPSSLLFDTVLHWGTLLSILAVFWRDFLVIVRACVVSLWRRSLADPHARLGWFIVLGSIPAAITGLLFKDLFETLFQAPIAVGVFLLVTAALLLGSEVLVHRGVRETDLASLSLADALVIGLAQAIALAPGISRSGSTIAAGLVRGLRREAAARFSFLLGTPAFLGAGLLQLVDALGTDPHAVAAARPALVVGFVVSAISGFIAIRFLLAYLRRHTLYLFVIYCSVVGVGVLLLSGLHLR